MDNRILGLIGAVLVIIGLFMPIISTPMANASMFDALKEGEWEAILLLLLGIGSIILAVLRQYRYLLFTGLATIIVLAIAFFRVRSSMASGREMAEQLGGAEAAERFSSGVGMSWGWIVPLLGGLALIAAGAMKSRNLPGAPNWGGAQPPPPPPYTPGR